VTDPKERQAHSIAARQFTENPLFQAMFEGVSASLESRALSCPSTDKDMAADVIRCKQLLAAMKREIERRVEDGEFAAFEIEELKKRSILRVFQR
jgi:hypothetical protein